MRSLILLFIATSTFVCAQKKAEIQPIPNLGLDSTKIFKLDDLLAKKMKKEDPQANSVFKILCKKPDTALYRMPNRKVKTDKLLTLKEPTKAKPNVEYFVPEYKFPKIEKKENQ